MERLNFAVEDADTVVSHNNDDIVDEEEYLSMFLVGRFLTDRPIGFHVIKDRMVGIWRPLGGILIRELEAGLYLFQFYNQVDVQRVLKGDPWSFDKQLLILSTIKEGVMPQQMPLFAVPFWVQVHDLPPGFMSEAVGKSLAGCLGELLEYDSKNASSSWRSFMRLRVLLDVRRPLLRKKKIRKEGGAMVIVAFKYEKLGPFCYLCGLLGHNDDLCPLLLTMTADSGERDWGPDLRVETRFNGGGGGARWLQDESVTGGINAS